MATTDWRDGANSVVNLLNGHAGCSLGQLFVGETVQRIILGFDIQLFDGVQGNPTPLEAARAVVWGVYKVPETTPSNSIVSPLGGLGLDWLLVGHAATSIDVCAWDTLGAPAVARLQWTQHLDVAQMQSQRKNATGVTQTFWFAAGLTRSTSWPPGNPQGSAYARFLVHTP